MEGNDFKLLAEYTEKGSDPAFSALTARYIRLVYSAALRQVNDPHAAEEITQVVFILLARKAHTFRPDVILSAWLLRTTRFTCTNFLVGQYRRIRREQQAMQTQHPSSEESSWDQIAPLLDEAMAALGEKDRVVLALRFFDEKSLEEVGAALGIDTGAAQKRVSRAVEKLRRYFARHGAAFSAAAITTALASHALQGAPSGLAASVAAAASLHGTAVSSSTATLLKGTLKLMAWTKAKTVAAAGVAVLLAAGTTTVTLHGIWNHTARQRHSYPWQVEGYDPRILDQAPPQLAILPSTVRYSSWGRKVDRSRNGQMTGTDKMMGTGVSAQTLLQVAYADEMEGAVPPFDDPTSRSLLTVVTTPLPAGVFDFIGSLPEGNVAGLRDEIKQQFGLVATVESRETNVLVLTVKNANAPGLKPGTPTDGSSRENTGEYSCTNLPISSLTRYLIGYFKIPIIDRTSVTNRFDIDLKWPETDPRHPNPEGLKQALLDQLGLELTPSVEPVTMLVIGKAE